MCTFDLQGDDNKKGKKKKSADLVELPFDSELPGNTDIDLQRYREEEVSLQVGLKNVSAIEIKIA